MIATDNKNSNTFHRVIDTISGIFMPIINVMMAAALLKGILMLTTNLGVLSESSGAYRILFAISDGFFHYLPIFLAYTASHKLKADTVTSMLLAAALVYPDITELFGKGMSLDFFCIRVNPVTYPASVIPIIMAIALLHYVEIPLEKYIHGTIKGFLKPMLALIIVTPITFLVFGPLGALIGSGLSTAYSAIYNFSPIAAGAVFGLIWQPMVVFGFQWGMVPVILEHLDTIGVDSFLPLCGPGVMGQAGAAMAVSFLAKNKKLKTVALSGSITAILGVTEPVLYAVNIPLKRPMIAACIAGSIGGAIVGSSGAGAVAFAYPSMLSLVVYFGKGFWTFFFAMILSFLISFFLGLLLRFNEADLRVDELSEKTL